MSFQWRLHILQVIYVGPALQLIRESVIRDSNKWRNENCKAKGKTVSKDLLDWHTTIFLSHLINPLTKWHSFRFDLSAIRGSAKDQHATASTLEQQKKAKAIVWKCPDTMVCLFLWNEIPAFGSVFRPHYKTSFVCICKELCVFGKRLLAHYTPQPGHCPFVKDTPQIL